MNDKILFKGKELVLILSIILAVILSGCIENKEGFVRSVIQINGSATGINFSNYSVEFGLGYNPVNWSSEGITLMNNGTSAVENGILATWNTSLVKDGRYTLRVIVRDNNGGSSRDIVYVTVGNIADYTCNSCQDCNSKIEGAFYGDTITLTEDIINSSDFTCIDITNDNITFDCQGHLIDGDGYWASDGIDIKGNNNLIKNCRVQEFDYGVYITDSRDNILRNNDLSNNTYNIYIDADNILNYYQDIDESNAINGRPIYYLINNESITINQNDNPGYFTCVSCRNITAKNLDISNNGVGITLINTSDSVLINNTLNSNGYGIYLFNSSNNILIDNLACDNYYDILDASMDDNQYINNTCDTGVCEYPCPSLGPRCIMDNESSLNLGVNNITFETPHPYENEMHCDSIVYECPHLPMRIYLKAITEEPVYYIYDYLYILDDKENPLDIIAGEWSNGNYNWTEFYETNTMKFEFYSDSSITDWGVSIQKIECGGGNVTTTTTTSTSTTSTYTTSTTTTTTTISGECPKGDENCDGTVSDFELLSYIDQWVQGSVDDFDLLKAIDNWAG